MTGNIVYPLPRQLPLSHSISLSHSLSRCFKVRRASGIAMKFMRLPTGNNNKLTTCGWISEILYFPLPLEHFPTFHTTPPSQLVAPGCSLLFAFGNFQLLIFQSVRTLLQLREAYWKYLSWPRIRIRIRMRNGNGNENSKAMADGGMANANATPSSLVSVSLSLSLGLYVFVYDRQRAKTLEKLSESVWEGVRTRS